MNFEITQIAQAITDTEFWRRPALLRSGCSQLIKLNYDFKYIRVLFFIFFTSQETDEEFVFAIQELMRKWGQ